MESPSAVTRPDFAIRFILTVAVLYPALSVARAAGADSDAPRYVPNQILVQFTGSSGDQQRAGLRTRLRAALTEAIWTPPMSNDKRGVLEVLTLPPGVAVQNAIQVARRFTGVEFAEPNWIYHHEATSNDPGYTNGYLWGMYGDSTTPANAFGSEAGEAWAAGVTGSRTVVIGVIDQGIQFTHPDLAANMPANPYDPLDGIDNDGNGYVDDYHGWDFAGNNNSVYDGGTAGNRDQHGTHVAGTIGAVGGNNRGVVGVNWRVSLASGKFIGLLGGTTANAIKAIDYFTDLKVRHGVDLAATSNSWGGGGFSQALLDAIVRGARAGILFVTAAGNGGLDAVGDDNDAKPTYPANYDTTAGAGYDAVISVAALQADGGLASFSNYGAATVDLGAPGVSIASTLPYNRYGALDGTSMATPHVTGAIALYASMCPQAEPARIRQALLEATTPTPSLSGKTATGGRLSIANLIAAGCR